MIINPYFGLDFSKQQKANLHTHTSQTTIEDVLYGSDGNETQADVIDAYYNKGYKILALTDHNHDPHSKVTTHPWTLFGRDPATLDMLAIEAKELSIGHHRNSFFNNLGDWNAIVTSSLTEIGQRSGLAIIDHPGEHKYPLAWHVDMFMTHKNLVGIEVYNAGNRFPDDIKTWDLINAITIPRGRVVYGYSNDDMHAFTALYKCYQFILSPTIAEADVKAAMLAGHTYFCWEPGGSGDAKAPRITNISVNRHTETITITADSGTVTWYTEATEAVGTGNAFSYADFDKSFVRASIVNQYGTTNTQPFAFMQTDLKVTPEKQYAKYGNAWHEIEKIYANDNGHWREPSAIKTR